MTRPDQFDELLQDVEADARPAVGEFLLALRDTVPTQPITPSAELARLMQSEPRPIAPLRHLRTPLVVLAVLVAAGTGVGAAAAASPEFRAGAAQVFSGLVGGSAPSGARPVPQTPPALATSGPHPTATPVPTPTPQVPGRSQHGGEGRGIPQKPAVPGHQSTEHPQPGGKSANAPGHSGLPHVPAPRKP
jgi:hypothetical protein